MRHDITAGNPSAAGPSELAERLHDKISSVPGVERLHPTIRYAVASVGAGNLRAASASLGRILGPGESTVDAYAHADGIVDVTVDISTDFSTDALAVCREIRRVITTEVISAGLLVGQIRVTVRG
jgi:hypothetical protein